MGTGSFGDDPIATPTVKGTVELEDVDTELSVKCSRERMGVVSTVIVPDPGMIPAHNEVGTPIVAPNDGVEDRFAWTGIAHGGREHPQEGSHGRQELLDEGAIPCEDRQGMKIAAFLIPNQRLDEHPVSLFKRHAQQVLMGSVRHIARLKAHDG